MDTHTHAILNTAFAPEVIKENKDHSPVSMERTRETSAAKKGERCSGHGGLI